MNRWIALISILVFLLRMDAVEASPNVLLIMTDDQGYGDIRSHGNRFISTPHLDRVAQEGARFDRFFVSPVCAPTRASLLTGRWHLRTGVHGVTRSQETMRADETTMAETFASAGYATGVFGKWHNGAHYPHDPNGQGFDRFYGFCAGHWNNYFDSFVTRNGKRESFQGFLIDRCTDEAIQFIQSNQNKPWLCYVPYNTPHTPWQVPDKYWEKYSAMGIGDEKAACAYAMVENIDDNVGRLLATLKTLGIDENTVVVFLTDNGANSDRYNAGMKGRKGSLHEGGTRVPCFIRWPNGIDSGRTINKICGHIDLLPTLAEMCDVAIPERIQIDGRSLVPLLKNDTSNWAERLLFAHWGNDAEGIPDCARGAVRSQKWRAVMYGKKWELYDMEFDPRQENDLAASEPRQVEELAMAYESWFAEVTQRGFDLIPTEIGHSAAPLVELPGHEATLHPKRKQGISYVGRSGWANDWVTDWTSEQSYPSWDVKIVQEGIYEVRLECEIPNSAVGSIVEVRIGDQSIEEQLTFHALAKDITSPDRIQRNEVYEKTWPVVTVGKIQLSSFVGKLSVHAKQMSGKRFIELKSVRVRRMPSR